MDQRLIDVSKTGDVDAFYALLREDQYILEGIDIAPFVDTPLHIAIEAKKTDFAVEIANLKPSFARKLNQAGLSPIHLASTYGNLKIVRELLSKDHDLCLLAGRGKRIPLHFAAEAGMVNVIKALLKDCPDSIGMLTVCEKTPLHLAAKNGQVEACKVLLEWIVELNRSELMNWKDGDGKTALEIAAESSPEVQELLANENHTLERKALHEERERRLNAWMKGPITNDSRSALLVVLALIITALYQAVVSPPGGVWQDTTPEHEAGKAVMGHMYVDFASYNAYGFCASIVATTLLINDIPFILQTLLMFCLVILLRIYDTSIKIIKPGQHHQFFSVSFTTSSVLMVLTTIFIICTFVTRFYRIRALFYYAT